MTTTITKPTLQLLLQQNAATSTALIDYYAANTDFQRLAESEGALTVARDQQDADKLQKGIDFASSKGVLDPNFVPEPYVAIDVLGKTPDQVADVILEQSTTNSESSNHVIVLVGLSGTGKGTTTTKLREKLEGMGHQVVTWSNGNIFRSVTLLAATWCEQQEPQVPVEEALTKENIQSFMDMLQFGKHPESGEYDIHIQGLGLDMYVSQVQNTELKSPKVSKNIPTVAEFTQVRFLIVCTFVCCGLGAFLLWYQRVWVHVLLLSVVAASTICPP